MGKLFGTDGYRGKANADLNCEIAMKIGVSVAHVLKENMGTKKINLVVGTDTRISKDMLSKALISGVLSEGVNIIDVGVMPSPAISYLICKYNADGGFVITASHNPSEDNGIKVLMKDGFKMNETLEEQVEDFFFNSFTYSNKVNDIGTYIAKKDALNDYVEYLTKHFDMNLENIKILIDTANGSASIVADVLFSKLKANFSLMNNNPDGLNINNNAGSTHIEGLRKRVIAEKYDIGIAYDGDADRAIFIDELGNVIDGDYVLAITAEELLKNNKLTNNTIVGTVMSNIGLIKFCEENNINFVATKVGDKYVLEEMLKNNYILGGEASGHIIFKEYENKGDGLFTSLQILNIMAKNKKHLSKLALVMKKYPQVLINVKVSKEGKLNYKDNEKIKEKIKEVEELLGRDGRVLIRPSGTEDLIRVMVEGKNEEHIMTLAKSLAEFIEKELKLAKRRVLVFL